MRKKRASTKKWLALTVLILVIVIGSVIYLGSESETPSPSTPTQPTPTSPSPTASPSPTQTTSMNDTERIMLLIRDYHEGLKTESINDVIEPFTDDASLLVHAPTKKFEFANKRQIKDYYNFIFNQSPPVDLLVHDISIEIDGVRAEATYQVIVNDRSGTEHFELVKIRGAWKVEHLTMFSLG